MGLTVGAWQFPGLEPPKLQAMAAALQGCTGLAVECGPEEGEMRLPSLREILFGWEVRGHLLRVCGFTPAHPYLWENLDGAMQEAGGLLGADPIIWRPDPRDAVLRRPWRALPRADRWLLRRASIAGGRPLDRFLSGRRAARNALQL